jgi:hypothetical protein
MDKTDTNFGVLKFDQFERGIFLWLHIIILALTSVFLLPLNFLWRHDQNWRTGIQAATLVGILFGTIFGYLEGNNIRRSFHSHLGYVLVFLSSVYILLTIAKRTLEYHFTRYYNKFRITQNVTNFAFIICTYIESVLGIVQM